VIQGIWKKVNFLRNSLWPAPNLSGTIPSMNLPIREPTVMPAGRTSESALAVLRLMA
jgi:hypothetical protein